MVRPASHHLTRLETATLVHLLVLLLAASWGYGGNIWWMRDALSYWGSLAPVLTLLACWQPGQPGRDARRRIPWLIPLVLFSAQVIASAFNPSTRPMIAEGDVVLVHTGAVHPDWPSTTVPDQSLRELWFLSVAYLSAFNLAVIPRSRRLLRLLLITGAVNCLVLAIFGTFQKLAGTDLYLGAARSPNPRFFATFIYYNHWGAFMILWLCAAAGLAFHHANRHAGRDVWHSPFTLAACGLLLIALTGPVSASRAATGMAAIVGALVTMHGLARIIAHRREARRSIGPPVVALLSVLVVAGGAVAWLAERSIHERYYETRVALERNQSLLGARMELYRDTWDLVRKRPVFGWGLSSYATTIELERPRGVGLRDAHENSYVDAHSDWLQSLSETGFVGTTLALLMGLIPLLASVNRAWRHPLVAYPLAGCGLIALYAWIEFPFGNAAVAITFWLLFFGSLRYAVLQRRAQADAPTSP